MTLLVRRGSVPHTAHAFVYVAMNPSRGRGRGIGTQEPLPVPACTVEEIVANFGSCPGLQESPEAGTLPCFTPGKDFVIPHFAFERRMPHRDYANVIPMYLPGPNLEVIPSALLRPKIRGGSACETQVKLGKFPYVPPWPRLKVAPPVLGVAK